MALRIDQFTSDYSDRLCDKLGIEFIAEHLTMARNKDDVVLDIPGYRQTKSYSCGFVSGLMVTRFFYPKYSHTKFLSFCQLNPEWGMSTRKVATALRKVGIVVKIRQGLTFQEIALAIEAREPVITSIKRKGDIQHWIVIYGINRKTKEIFVAGEKFWFSLAPTVFKWEVMKKQIPKGNDFLVCERKA